ncbi:MAG TPA: metallophosphoesterase [Kofleriaceae bacterium]|nr:metallophosphoesterase [Kofleriaceae bacterium]
MGVPREITPLLVALAGCLSSPEASEREPPAAAAAGKVAVDDESVLEDWVEDMFELGHHAALATGDLSLGPAPSGDLLGRHVADCGPQADTAPGAFGRLPYLQRERANEASILWTQPPGPPAEVHLWSADKVDDRRLTATRDASRFAAPHDLWFARADRLRPAAVYCYQLLRAGRRVFGPVGFRAPPDDLRRARVLVFGDMGHRTIDQSAVFAQLLRAPVDFALLAGDIAYDSGRPDELEQNFFAIYAPLMARVPFFPAAGNHDYRTLEGAPLRAAFALPDSGSDEGRERWYSFDWGPLHVAVIDSQRLVPAQLAWLDRDLAAAARPWTVAVLHRPPFSAGDHGDDPEIQQLVHPILARRRVPLVFAGHDHDYERTVAVDGVTYVVTGGGGRGTKAVGRTARTAFATRVAHHVLLEADERELRLWAVDARGTTFDTARITRPAAGSTCHPPARCRNDGTR